MLSNIPDKKVVEITVNKIFKVLFPLNEKLIAESIDLSSNSIMNFITLIFKGLVQDDKEISDQFTRDLPGIKILLIRDAEFILESDPAARNLVEVIAVYPGFFAIYCYRLAHSVHLSGVPLLPRMITEYAHRITGIDIHPGAEIGNPFSIDHGTGIVIGETTNIGRYVKVYQGVTLGALSVDKSKASSKRHPTIEDNVILYAGSTILGGETVVGRNSIIGGNVWLTQSVGSDSVVYHKSEIIVRGQNKTGEPINFTI